MSYDEEDERSSVAGNKQESVPTEIAPLDRVHEMASGDGGEDNIPMKQNKDGADSHDMYPGFARLFSQQLSNAGFRGDALEPRRFSEEGKAYLPDDDRKIAARSDESKVEAGLKKPPPESRKRRRPSEGDMDNTKQHRERSKVQHTYHDYSGLSGDFELPALKQKGRGGVSSMFPTVLHHMLDEAERQGFSHIVSWQPHGRAFHVHLPEKFVADVMPKYFRHTRISSFQRQLSLYGFTRLARKGPDRGAYYHECFLRGMVHLCPNIQRTRVKGTMVRQSASPETEPDFSTLPPVGVDHANSLLEAKSSLQETTASASSNRLESGRGDDLLNENRGGTTATSQLAYNDIMFNNLQDPNRRAMSSTGQDPFNDLRVRSESLRNEMSQPPPPPPRAWGSKYMRHLLTRTMSPQEEGHEDSGEDEKQEKAQSPSSEVEGSSQSSNGSTGKAQSKRDEEADLAVFLEEVDLDSDSDECQESEEAMARILEQDVNQKSEV